MNAARYILALDQGTTSSRSLLFDADGQVVAQSQREITQHFPKPGWVEHDPIEILDSQLFTVAAVLEKAGVAPRDIAAVGITNQRETTVLWDRATGLPVAPAIVWQDRRTADACAALRAAGVADEITARTGRVCFANRYAGWIGIECPSVRTAIWLMRAMTVENVLARREDTVLFLPAHPRFASDGRMTRLIETYERVQQLCAVKKFE
jgi:glycerol kinase